MHENSQLRSGNAGRTAYYDLALLALPLPLLVGSLLGALSTLPLHRSVGAGAVVSALALGHLLFRDPPTRRGPRRRGLGPSG